MTAISEVMRSAMKFVQPTKSEEARVNSAATALLAKTQKAASRYSETRGAILGGSFAKGTWLPGHVDLDVYVRIDPSVPEDRFEQVGLAVGGAATRGFPRGKKFAQHPYTEAEVDGIRVNVVPCYAVENKQWKSAADRSPFHVDLVRALDQGSKNHIKLLKRFMKAVGVYGAEIETQGFSGYVAEVLVIKHGDLEGVLNWFANFSPGENGRIFSLPDPVDEGRDLGIAVSGEKVAMMVLASREFLRRPSLAFFQNMGGKHHAPLSKAVIALVFSHAKLSEDTLWGELRKTSKHLVRHLEVNGFKVARWMGASNNSDRSAILLIPEFTSLPEVEQRVGPTVDRRKDVEAFVYSNQKRAKLVWVDEQTRVRILRPREHRRLTTLLKAIAGGKEGHVGASPELERGMKKSAKILQGGSLIRAARSTEWLNNGIREITSDAIGTRPS